MGQITEFILNRETEAKSEFVVQMKIPLGTKRPYAYYHEHGSIPESEIVYLKVKKGEMQSIMILASSGRGKTQLIKRLLGYYHLFNYKLLIFEPKERPEYLSMNNPGKFTKIHPKEKPLSIPIKGFVPTFAKNEVWPSLTKNLEEFSMSIKQMNRIEDWQTVDVSGGGSMKMQEYIKRRFTFEQIMNIILADKMHPTIRQSLMLKLGNIYQNKVFNEKVPSLDIMKCWGDGYAASVCYFNQYPRYMSLYTGKELNKLHYQALRDPFPKMIVIEDLPPISPREADPEIHIAKRKIRDCLTLWRALGFNIILSAQNSSLIDPIDVNECAILLIGNIGDTDIIAKKVANPKIVETVKNLYYNKNARVRQWCYVHEDNYTYETFFPFDSLVGHEF